MQVIKTALKSALLGLSMAGLGFVAGPLAAKAEMPAGYTRSTTFLKGQHCYVHNNEAEYYCYRNKLSSSSMMKDHSMMKSNSSMMKNDGTMMKNDGTMMKHDGAMMKNDGTMMKKP